jgi:hypothetical protein
MIRHLTPLLSSLALVTVAACNSGGSDAAQQADDGAAAPTAWVAEDGVQGNFTGTLDKAGMPVENHTITVMTDGQGAPQIGFWEFCNVDMTGEGPDYTSVEGSSCFIDLGEGQKAYGATATANYADDTLTATVTFENGTTWSFTGTR